MRRAVTRERRKRGGRSSGILAGWGLQSSLAAHPCAFVTRRRFERSDGAIDPSNAVDGLSGMDKKKPGRRPAWGKIILILGVAAALGAAWRYTPLAELITPQRLTEWSKVARRTPWAPFALVFAYVPAVLVMFP